MALITCSHRVLDFAYGEGWFARRCISWGTKSVNAYDNSIIPAVLLWDKV